MKVQIFRDSSLSSLRKIVIEISNEKGVLIERRLCFGALLSKKRLEKKLSRIVDRMLGRIAVYNKVMNMD